MGSHLESAATSPLKRKQVRPEPRLVRAGLHVHGAGDALVYMSLTLSAKYYACFYIVTLHAGVPGFSSKMVRRLGSFNIVYLTSEL